LDAEVGWKMQSAISLSGSLLCIQVAGRLHRAVIRAR
jgi:hypothetical protein